MGLFFNATFDHSCTASVTFFDDPYGFEDPYGPYHGTLDAQTHDFLFPFPFDPEGPPIPLTKDTGFIHRC